MKYAELGHTGITVSRLCCGGLTVSPLQLGLSPEEGGRIYKEAFDNGVTFTDTGQLYKTYRHLRWGLEHSDNGDKVVIASKSFAKTAVEMQDSVEEARRELNRDCIDIFLLHGITGRAQYCTSLGAAEMLRELKSKGIVKAIGLSTHNISGVRLAIEEGFDVVHPLINKDGWGIADGTADEMSAAICEARGAGLGVYAMKSLGGGNLHKQAAKCFDYVLDDVACDSVAVGMSSVCEVRENIAYFDTRAFPAGYSVEGRRQKHILIERFCTGCGKCVKMCNQGALSIENGRAVWNGENCVLCGYCSTACPGLFIRVV